MINKLDAALKPLGMFVFGGFHITAEDNIAGNKKTLLLVGNAGSDMFDALQADELDKEHPMDRWTEKQLTKLATTLNADIRFPFGGGPPWHPFQQWAKRAGQTFQSPIQMLIHSKYGLWHAYRAAFVFDEILPLTKFSESRNPCDGCARPCRQACPVNAFSDAGYNVDRCIAHIQTAAGKDCRQNGCLARRVCPIGVDYQYHATHSDFHMQAFIKSR